MTGQPEEATSPDAEAGRSRLQEILQFITDGHAPLQVGDVALDDEGHLCLRRDGEARQFSFSYRGVDFLTRMETQPEASITLSAELGAVPYSMEEGPNRHLTRRIVEATADLPGGRIEVHDFQDMHLVAAAKPPLPLTPASVMATITSLLLLFRPYLDLLHESLAVAPQPQAAPCAPNSSAAPEA